MYSLNSENQITCRGYAHVSLFLCPHLWRWLLLSVRLVVIVPSNVFAVEMIV